MDAKYAVDIRTEFLEVSDRQLGFTADRGGGGGGGAVLGGMGGT